MNELKCDYCGKIYFKKVLRKDMKHHYCSHKCYTTSKRKYNKFILENNLVFICTIAKNKEYIFIIDKEDFDKVKDIYWMPHASKGSNSLYARGRIYNTYKHILLHRLVVNCPENMIIDHVNRNTLDNRKENLRVCNMSINNENKGMQKNNTSGYKHISWNKHKNKWAFNIQRDFKFKTIYENKDIKKVLETRNKYYIENNILKED